MRWWCASAVGVLAALALPARSSAQTLLAGPYLRDVGAQGAGISLELDAPQALVLTLFEPGQPEPVQQVSAAAATLHHLRVEGLQAGRRYRYELHTAAGAALTPPGDPSFELRTAAVPGDSFRFAVVGDPRPGEEGNLAPHRRVLRQMLHADPSFVLVLGDLVDDGRDPEQWRRYLRTEGDLLRRSALFAVRGDNDHQRGAGLTERYLPRTAAGPYAFTWGGLRFIALDVWDATGLQSGPALEADSPQYRWLEHELLQPDTRAAPLRIVFLHDPVRLARGRSAEVLRRVWMPLFQRGRVDLVFASWHLYERAQHEGVSYVVTGGGGAPLVWMPADPSQPSQVEARRHHYCRVDVNSGGLNLQAVADDGTILDELFLGPRGAAPPTSERLLRVARRLADGAPLATPGLPPLALFHAGIPAAGRAAAGDGRLASYDLRLPGRVALAALVAPELLSAATPLPWLVSGVDAPRVGWPGVARALAAPPGLPGEAVWLAAGAEDPRPALSAALAAPSALRWVAQGLGEQRGAGPIGAALLLLLAGALLLAGQAPRGRVGAVVLGGGAAWATGLALAVALSAPAQVALRDGAWPRALQAGLAGVLSLVLALRRPGRSVSGGLRALPWAARVGLVASSGALAGLAGLGPVAAARTLAWAGLPDPALRLRALAGLALLCGGAALPLIAALGAAALAPRLGRQRWAWGLLAAWALTMIYTAATG